MKERQKIEKGHGERLSDDVVGALFTPSCKTAESRQLIHEPLTAVPL